MQKQSQDLGSVKSEAIHNYGHKAKAEKNYNENYLEDNLIIM
jgi:hypothetical protein